MTTLTATRRQHPSARRPRDAAAWIGLAASPTFAAMACLTAGSHLAVCGAASGILPIGGMAWMYLLMSLVHLSPWLRLASDLPRRLITSPTEGD